MECGTGSRTKLMGRITKYGLLFSVESCSTSPVDDDEDPLLCPHGYYCHVTHQGNPAKGFPNSGYCVKETDGQCKYYG